MRVVGALVGTAALAPLSGPEETGFGGDEGGAQVEGVREVAVALGVGSHVHVFGCFLDLLELAEGFPEPFFGTHHPAALPHRVAEGALQGAGELFTLLDVGVDLVARGLYLLAGAGLGLGGPGEGGGGFAGAAAEDHGLGERVAPEPVRPRSEEHTSELQSRQYRVCRLLIDKNT